MGYQDVDIAFYNALFPFVTLVRIAFYIFVFKLLLKLNKYLNRELKHDCTTCEYKQKCIKDQLANLPSDKDNFVN